MEERGILPNIYEIQNRKRWTGDTRMPLTAEEYNKGTEGINEIVALLMAHPDTAYSLHEIEEALIGPGMNRIKHLDVFIADLTLLAPLLFMENTIGHRVIDGIPYFRWQG